MNANAALSQLSYEPILAIFHRKKLRKLIFRIFDFEGIVRKIGLLNWKGTGAVGYASIRMRTERSPN